MVRKHAPNRGHALNKGWNTSHAQPFAIDYDKVHNAYTLFKMVNINVGSEDSILRQSGHDVFKEMWTQQHSGNFKKISLIAKKQEAVFMTDKW